MEALFSFGWALPSPFGEESAQGHSSAAQIVDHSDTLFHTLFHSR